MPAMKMQTHDSELPTISRTDLNSSLDKYFIACCPVFGRGPLNLGLLCAWWSICSRILHNLDLLFSQPVKLVDQGIYLAGGPLVTCGLMYDEKEKMDCRLYAIGFFQRRNTL